MAANAILEYFREKKVILVYNSYSDKEYSKILEILKPIIQEVQILDIQSERSVLEDKLIDILNTKSIKYSKFIKLEVDFEYLVFGSFSVVEAFLKRI